MEYLLLNCTYFVPADNALHEAIVHHMQQRAYQKRLT